MRKTTRPVIYVLIVALILPMWPAVSLAAEFSGDLMQEAEGSGWVITSAHKWAVVPKESAAPSIDGQLDEPMWQNAAMLQKFATAFYERPVGHHVIYRLAYDEDYIYIGGSMAQAEADTLAQIEIVMRPTVGAGDHYVVNIDVNPQSPSLSTILNALPDGVDLSVDLGRQNIENVLHHMSSNGNEWFVEAAVPISEIVPEGVTAGDEWQLNILHIHNLYTVPLNSWAPVRNATHWHAGGESARLYISVIDQDRMGSIYFDKMPETIPPHGKHLIHWQLEGELLKYIGFTDKQLQLDLSPLIGTGSGSGSNAGQGNKWGEALKAELEWKAPHGSWEPLSIADQQRDGNMLTVHFSHPPALTDGLYHLRIMLCVGNGSHIAATTLSFDREALVQAGLSTISIPPSTEPVAEIDWSEPSAEVLEVLEIIPEQPGFRFVGLPEMPELYPDNLYTLSEDKKSLISNRTGTVYPNEQFPEDQSLTVQNGLGETVVIPYHEDAAGNKYFITAHLWYLQKSWAIDRTEQIAKTDPLGAARLLYEWTQKYRGYNPTGDRVGSGIHFNGSSNKDAGPPYAYWGGIWNRWYLNDLTSITELIRAYEAVKQTNAFELLSDELGLDVEQYFIEELLIPSADFVLSYVNRYGNMAVFPWIGLVRIGKALNEPDYIHRVVEQVEAFATSMFLADGFWKEVTLSYHMQTANTLSNVLNELRGWSDPPGYVSPRTGIRFDDLNMEEQFPIIAKALDISKRVAYPDGKVLPIMDTWANQRPSGGRIDEGSFLLPAAGIGRLAGGEGLDQTQVYLYFQPKYGHNHYDGLNLNIFAQGQELLPDLGYTHNSIYRYFSLSTMGHNTVVADSKNMSAGGLAKDGGQVRAYVPDGGMFQAMRASYDGAYASTEQYNREPWFVPFPDGDGSAGYVLDLFRVSGGNRHEYTFQGDANRDAYFETELALTEYGGYLLPPGTNVVEPINNSDSGSAEGHYPGYIYVREVEQAQLLGDQFSLTLVTEEDGVPGAKMNITGLLDDGANELYLGRSPSLRSIRLHGSSMDNNDEAVKYDMPKLVLRRDGTDLDSTFVTVFEPYAADERPRIEAIDRLELDEGPEGAVAVRVIYGNTTDLLISNPYHPESPVVVDDLIMTGEMGMVRLIDGRAEEMSLVGGTLLQKGEQQLLGSGKVTGMIEDAKRAAAGDEMNAFVTQANVPQEAVGRYMIITHPDGSTSGYEIGDVVQTDGRTLIVLSEHDPDMTFDSDRSQQVYFPHRSWTGDHVFSIALANHAQNMNGEDPNIGKPTGTVTGAVYDPDGTPVKGVQVRLTGNTQLFTWTDENGQFVLSGIPVGKQRVTVTYPSYVTAVSDPFEAAADSTITVFVHLKERQPPRIISELPFAVPAGEMLEATSSVSGDIYAVPADTPPTLAELEYAVQSGMGVKTASEMNESVQLDLSGLPPGMYRIYAADRWGQISTGHSVAVVPADVQMVDDSDPWVLYEGNWTLFASSHYYGGSLMLSQRRGDYVDIPFYGKRAQLLGTLNLSKGKADVYVDGEYKETIDQFRSGGTQYQSVFYDTGLLPEDLHVIRLVVKGERSDDAVNTQVTFDALRILDQ